MKTIPRIIRINHTTPGGENLYHRGPGCLTSTDRGEAAHYVTDEPKSNVAMVRGHFEAAQAQGQLIGLTTTKGLKTCFEVVPANEVRDEDLLAFQRRFPKY